MGVLSGQGSLHSRLGPFQSVADPGRVCIEENGSAAQVHVLGTRRPSGSKRCTAPFLGSYHLPLPPSSPPTEGLAKGADSGDKGGTDLPQVAHSSVVAPRDVHDVGAPSTSAPIQAGPSQGGGSDPPSLPGPVGGSKPFSKAFAVSNAGFGLDKMTSVFCPIIWLLAQQQDMDTSLISLVNSVLSIMLIPLLAHLGQLLSTLSTCTTKVQRQHS